MDGFDDLLAAVAEGAAEQAGGAVENTIAFVAEVVDALALANRRGSALKSRLAVKGIQ